MDEVARLARGRRSASRRRYFVILIRDHSKSDDWYVYKGNRGGLDPSLYETKKEAEQTQRQIAPSHRTRCVKIVELFEAKTW